MAIARSLQEFMTKHHVSYKVIPHRRTASSTETAAAAHVPGGRLAKSVILADENGFIMAVLPATHHIDLGVLKRQLHRSVGLATEHELRELFLDCEPGAIPPVGAAYDLETVIDDSLCTQGDVYFECGDHEELIQVSGEQFQELIAGSRQYHFSHQV